MTADRQQDFAMILASSVHDIKNALSLIGQELQLLVDGLTPEQAEKTARLQHEVNRMNATLVQLLLLYKHDHQQLHLDIDMHNVAELIEEQLCQFDVPLQQQDIKVDVNIDDTLDWVFDSHLLGVVVSNLLGNSLRYCHDWIGISADIIDDYLCIQLEDDGNGFPEEMLTQENHAILGTEKGHTKTGLGLHFARLISEMHRCDDRTGSIELKNTDQGSCLIIRLP